MSDLGLLIAEDASDAVQLELLTADDYAVFSTGLSQLQQNWLQSCDFTASAGACIALPGDGGELDLVLLIVADYAYANMQQFFAQLPAAEYAFSERSLDLLSDSVLQAYILDFARQHYSYLPRKSACAQLIVANVPDFLLAQIAAEQRLRDLINTPTEELSTNEFANEIKSLASEYDAKLEVYKDDLKTSFPAVWSVGRASDNPPQVVNLQWGNPDHPRLALVGKGVCYDTGGLNLKPGNSMLLMKKDMSGAAHALALAEMIMATELPIYLDVWIPMAENSISGASYRPGDVINTRLGKRVEITNTDAEGRLLLADGLAAACEGKPDLVLDFASLTGAARVALGPDLVPFFAANTRATDLNKHSLLDDFWEMPLYDKYKSFLNSEIADIMNASLQGKAGAITAALFLREFVASDTPWLHFDIFAHDNSSGAKASVGAKAQGLSGCYHFIKNKLLETANV